MSAQRKALIVGVGDGLSASLAHLLHRQGYSLALAARNIAKLSDLAKATEASVHTCDASDADDVAALFSEVGSNLDVVIYNPSFRVRGPLAELNPADVRKTLDITAFGAFLVGQQAVRAMLKRGSGTILFTGASAGVKGYPQSAPFAMGKFALRGLAQSMAREFHPQGIHIAHVIIDGAILSARYPDAEGKHDKLHPDAIARAYVDLINQDRTCWSWEIEVRPWVEKF